MGTAETGPATPGGSAVRRGSTVWAVWAPAEIFATFDQTGGRIGSGVRGSGQGGVGRCRR